MTVAPAIAAPPDQGLAEERATCQTRLLVLRPALVRMAVHIDVLRRCVFGFHFLYLPEKRIGCRPMLSEARHGAKLMLWRHVI